MKKLTFLLVCCSMLSLTTFAQDNTDEKIYGDNLITFKPFMGHATPQIGDVGVGVAYERFLNDFISAKIPFNIGLVNNLIQSGVGLKFYPAGHNRPVKYAVGPTILFGKANGTDYVSNYDSTGQFWTTREVENPLTQIGFMLTNSLNLTIQKNIYIGVEMGLGINYINDFKYDNNQIYPGYYNNNRDEDPGVLFQFGIELGYRF